MDENPYKTTPGCKAERAEKLSDGAVVLRAAALICWGISLLLAWPLCGMIVVLSEVPPTFVSPILTWPLAVSIIPLPFAGFLVLGFAAWFRSRRLAVFGACGFIPLPLYFAYAAFAGFTQVR